MHPSSRTFLVMLTFSASLLAMGCGAGLPSTMSDPVSLHISGSVFGGQQPVLGASIQLYTVGTTAAGAASTALITGTPVVTVAGGTFSITGTYSCASATQVYIVASGGDPGAGVNSALRLIAALGPCSNLTASTFISINELTTVAAAYALAPFEGASFSSIGASSGSVTGSIGLPNAFQTASLLLSTAPPTGVTVPTAELNTLANILSSCVNSTGASSAGCTQLLSATGAGNTADAAFYIAKNPGLSAVTGLYSLSSASGPFQPSLTTAPMDFSVAINYTGPVAGTFSGPTGIAIDAGGNALITQQTGNRIVAVSPLNSSLSASTNLAGSNLNGPQGIAIDRNGYVWVANTLGHNAARIAPYSASVSTFPSASSYYFALSSGVSNPVAIATDIYTSAYTLSPAEHTIYVLNDTGTSVLATLTNSAFTGSGAFAFAGASTLEVGNSAGQDCEINFAPSANPNPSLIFYNAGITCIRAGSAASISALNYNQLNGGSAGYAGLSSTGAPLFGRTDFAPSILLGPAAGTPTSLAFDYSGRGFVTSNNALFAYDVSGNVRSPAAGFGTLNTPAGVAVDPSGNVWTTNYGDNSISIFVGLGVPTSTPIAAILH